MDEPWYLPGHPSELVVEEEATIVPAEESSYTAEEVAAAIWPDS